jgi:hypothetical protein
MTFSLARYVSPRKYRREQEEQARLQSLRQRDGDDCRRCRRPMRFDLPAGHDLGPKIENMGAAPEGEPRALDHLFLCHGRCNADADRTQEVIERVRRKNEADLFAKAKRRA